MDKVLVDFDGHIWKKQEPTMHYKGVRSIKDD